MEIKTKYSIGDKIYFLSENKIQSADIEKIKINAGQIRTTGELYQDVYYIVSPAILFELEIHESKAFTSREQLILSL